MTPEKGLTAFEQALSATAPADKECETDVTMSPNLDESDGRASIRAEARTARGVHRTGPASTAAVATAVGISLSLAFRAAADADTASPAPSPKPSAVTIHAVFAATEAYTSGVNAIGSFDTPNGVDLTSRFDVSDAFAILTKTSGTLQYALQAGVYSIPTIGGAGNKTIQTGANTDLFGPVPLAYLEYAPSGSFDVSAGILATLTGAESTFTYQDWNIQRGAVWNVENAVSRGIRASWSRDKVTLTLGANDGYYSGNFGAAEAAVAYAPDPSESILAVWLDPNPRTPGNKTTSIANKQLLNLVYSRTQGKLQLAPYVLWARSPSSTALGYANSESAFGGAFLANLSWSESFSTALRWETLHDSSAQTDTSANADLIGYGPGSGITSWTLTPAWKLGGGAFLRIDLSEAHVSGAAPGLAFDAGGNGTNQSRVVLELGAQI